MERPRAPLVVLTGVFKLVKATLLLPLGVLGAAEMSGRLARMAEAAGWWMGALPGRLTLQRLAQQVWFLEPARLHRLGLLTLAYAAVFVVEGVGLVRQRRWAEWLTVVVTTSFIPFEVYELARRTTPARVVALLLNVAIAAYLAWRRLSEMRHRPPHPAIRAVGSSPAP